MPKLRVYPRGFLGIDLGPSFADAAKAQRQLAQQNFYHIGEVNQNKSIIDANESVEALYAQYIRSGVQAGSFEFRKQVLVTAIAAFGVPMFSEWFFAQYQSPAAGDLHNRFLLDTLHYLEEGRREMSLETWGALLVIAPESDQIGKIPEVAREFFGVESNGVLRPHYAGNRELTSIIQMWCSKPNGLEDLLGTLHLLFGRANS